MPDPPPVPPRVIVVDDHADFRFLLRTSLEGRGCIVVGEAPDGQAAVELAAAVECDRIVMDFRMPVMDGASATRLILQRFPAVEVIAFTDSGEVAGAFFDAGASAYFPKSQFSELLAHVSRPLDGDGSRGGDV